MNWKKLAEAVDSVRHRVRLKRWDRERALGRRAEDLAHRHLERSGLTIVARNFTSRLGHGEIDLIAWDGPTLVFIEVKARADESVRSAEANVGAEKQARIVRTAGEYLRRARVPWEAARFDVVTVVLSERTVVRHLRDAFGWR